MNALIIGSGRSISDYRESILKLIDADGLSTIGINKMTDLCIPDYHLWTNRKQLSKFHGCIDSSSQLLLGSGLPANIISKYCANYDYRIVNYEDKPGTKVAMRNGKIYGFFRTAGALAIMVAAMMEANEIYIVGMDGYTLHGKDDLEKGRHSQHCYGSGHTDDADWNKCVIKDQQVQDALDSICKYGVNFTILTPTKFEKYYDPGVLNEFEE